MPYPLPPQLPPVASDYVRYEYAAPQDVTLAEGSSIAPLDLPPESETSLSWVGCQTLASLNDPEPLPTEPSDLTVSPPEEEILHASTRAADLGPVHIDRSPSQGIEGRLSEWHGETEAEDSSGLGEPTATERTEVIAQRLPRSMAIPVESAESEPVPIPLRSDAVRIAPPKMESVIELTADRQEFDDQRQIFTAEGNVVMRFEEALLRSDQLQVNLINRLARGVGNVSLVSGEQILLGSEFLYNFVQGTGTITQARGVVYIPTAQSDFDLGQGTGDSQLLPPGERILLDQPPTDVTDAGGVIINVGGGQGVTPQAQQGGQVRRVRFEAEQLNFTPEGWQAVNVRFTNDPFSPPELEVRADRAQLTRISPLEDEVLATRPRLVFDQRLPVPLLRDRLIISREERDPAIISFGYDDRDRGGLFIERTFEVHETRQFTLRLTPQFLVQRALGFSTENREAQSTPLEDFRESWLSWIGLRGTLKARLTPQTTLDANLNLAGLNNIGDTARANVQLQQMIAKHTLSAEYTYRNRFYNGSLGFQTVDRSIGIVLASPVFKLEKTGILVNYQGSFQNIYAPTDRLELLEPKSRGRASLNRIQLSATLRRNFSLWKGQPLASTPTEGLKYTPKPIVPYVQFLTGLTATAGFYSNGESQSYLQGLMGIQGQFGHFSRPWFDYTGFTLLYAQFIPTGESPFRFDRVADVRVLSLELNQQLYGPVRIATRVGINLDTGKSISTDYLLEYSRRTYGLTFRYNPDLGLAALGFRLGDFNWSGVSQSFSTPNIRQATPTVTDSF